MSFITQLSYSIPAETVAVLQVQEVTNVSTSLLSMYSVHFDIRIPLKIQLF